MEENGSPTAVESLPAFVELYSSDSGSGVGSPAIRPALETDDPFIVFATDCMSATELRLRRWFKCTKFADNCFATRNSCQQFLDHLADRHTDQQLYCLYCNHIGDEGKVMYAHQQLVDHIIATHPHRQYQCNLCLYRSISVEHILIHQWSIHSRSFAHTFADRSAPITPEALAENIGVKRCKVIECTALTDEPRPEPLRYYQRFGAERLNRELSQMQCCFCDYLDNSRDELYAHCVDAHPDYPIIVYAGLPGLTAVNGDDDENTVDSFDRPIGKTRKRSVDETDVTTNGVIDTYEFDIWTESEDEDIVTMLTEDDFSSDGEPVVKRRRSEADNSGANTGATNSGRDDVQSLIAGHNNYTLCLAVCVSAVIVAYLSVVVLTR